MPSPSEKEAPDAASSPPTITKLAAQKKDTSRASVFLDGEYAFGLHQDLLLKHGLHKGVTLSLEEQRALQEEDAVMLAKAKAMRYVARRARTITEVRRKLREKEHPEPAIDVAVARLEELGYLDDADYAREYVRSRFASKGYGPVRLRQELKRRGVGKHQIEDALLLMDEGELLDAAREHARKRWPRLSDEDDPYRRRQKLNAYLRRRGFSYDVIRRVTDEVTQDT
jgi:regulatory protein